MHTYQVHHEQVADRIVIELRKDGHSAYTEKDGSTILIITTANTSAIGISYVAGSRFLEYKGIL